MRVRVAQLAGLSSSLEERVLPDSAALLHEEYVDGSELDDDSKVPEPELMTSCSLAHRDCSKPHARCARSFVNHSVVRQVR